MATDKQTKKAYDIARNYEKANIEYIIALSEQAEDIANGNADLVAIHEQQQINLRNIRKEMLKAEAKSVKQTNALISEEARKVYKQMSKFYKAKNVVQLPFNKNRRILNSLVAIEKITEGNFKNLSRTTVKDVNYRKCIDRSILAVQSGAENYQEAIRKAIRQATKKGVQVEYSGNRTRRLDTAVRMNVLDGVRQMQIEVNKICGEEFGADGVEIDAHGLCAEDHISIQGKRMSEKQYRQRVLDRKDVRNIGSNNCQHMLKAIVMGVGKPAYSKEQLEEMRKYTEEPLDALGGKNRRDASNEMRVLETRARECKEQLIAFKNDPKEKARYERRLDRTMAKYKDLTKKSGLKPQYDRMKIE